MQESVRQMLDKYARLEHSLASGEILSDPAKYAAAMKEYNALTPIVKAIRTLEETETQLAAAEEMARNERDAEMRALAAEEAAALRERLGACEETLRRLTQPRDARDDANVIVEIRAGTGGEEAALFAAELYRMYTMFAASRHFSCETVDVNETELGGLRRIEFLVNGRGAFGCFKYESGVHRVQRVPATESNGKLQTSAATVAVLPEREDVQIEIAPEDVKIEATKSTGAGGQHINKTLSAIRLTHLPSGIVIECQDERSQLRNKEKAMRILRARLYDREERAQKERVALERRAQVGSGDRSQRIRTYNYREGRVTDHRIGLTLYTLPAILNGALDPLLAALAEADAAEKIKESENSNG